MHSIFHVAVSYLVVPVMLWVGLRARGRDIFDGLRNPKRLVTGVFAIVIAVPLLALAVVALLPVPKKVATLLVLFSICPASPLVLPSLQKRGPAGSVGLALVVVLLAASIVTVPAWVWILDPVHAVSFRAYAGDVGAMLAAKLLLPLVAGMAVRRMSTRLAHLAGQVVTVLIAAAMVLAAIALAKFGASSLGKITLPIAFAAALIVTGDTLLIGRIAPKQDPALRDAISNIAARGNPALALAVISHNDPSLGWGGFVSAYVILRALGLLLFKLLSQRAHPARASQGA
jgi:BASS family bile acid:Na+ symporter